MNIASLLTVHVFIMRLHIENCLALHYCLTPKIFTGVTFSHYVIFFKYMLNLSGVTLKLYVARYSRRIRQGTARQSDTENRTWNLRAILGQNSWPFLELEIRHLLMHGHNQKFTESGMQGEWYVLSRRQAACGLATPARLSALWTSIEHGHAFTSAYACFQ